MFDFVGDREQNQDLEPTKSLLKVDSFSHFLVIGCT